ncbi:carboxylesterase/lipase family protein [Amnibacterium setariae]|uniref:Carboxylic ester hydrolase n=1 Tax=Amnibacterium setariae TaxID=2306585 RepID=A0A3A1TVS6_9MICO|nr:carboxylesterase/lipase family protein [Amnibacterium setariae]RIX27910.1 carboxylesterase/lipase family protein [Amnibacterium setariae]
MRDADADAVPTVVATTAGRVRGGREAGLTVWRGVPYAAPPVGRLRFRAPRPPVPWPGVRDATTDGPLPPQPRSSTLTGAGLRTPMAEDSLTLTVARRTGGAPRKPVMVFVYGGAFGIGGATAGAYRGETLAAAGDVVFVGFNYRVGALGWLDLSAYGTPDEPIETNVGLRDQLAALEWVRDNIAAFGGDPDDVTLFGESAGGTSVLTLLAVPAARGLFARAIAESPAIGSIHGSERSAGWAAELVEALPGGAAALRTIDPDDLVAATNRLDLAVSDRLPAARVLGPVVDGDLVPDYPLDVLRRGEGLPVPLVVGTNADEGTLFQRMRGLRATPGRMDRLFDATVPDAKAGLLAEYGGGRGARALERFVTDLMFWNPAVEAAAGHAAVAPTWMYRFDFAPPAMRAVGLGAAHGSELDHVLARRGGPTRRLATLLGGDRAARALTGRMSGAWLDFARTGAAPAWWPRFDEATRATWVFDRHDRLEQDPRERVRAAWRAWHPYG